MGKVYAQQRRKINVKFATVARTGEFQVNSYWYRRTVKRNRANGEAVVSSQAPTVAWR